MYFNYFVVAVVVVVVNILSINDVIFLHMGHGFPYQRPV